MGADWSFGLTHNGQILPLVRTIVNFKKRLAPGVGLPLPAPA
jgi:hypothetical protein